LSWSGSVTTVAGPVVSEGYPAVIVLELERREHFCPLSQFPSHRRAELPRFLRRGMARVNRRRVGGRRSSATPRFLRRGTARTCFHVELPPSPHQGDELLTGSDRRGVPAGEGVKSEAAGDRRSSATSPGRSYCHGLLNRRVVGSSSSGC
jgi:hypothetical protein